MAKQRIGLNQGVLTSISPAEYLARQHIPKKMESHTLPDDGLQKLDKLLSGSGPSICINRGGGIGDVLMTTPAVRAIKKKYPTSTLTYATDFGYLDGALVKVLDGNPYIDQIVDQGKIKSTKEFDVYINLHCPCVAHEQPGAPPVHRIDLFARHAGITLDDPHVDYYLKPEEKRWGADFLWERKISKRQWVVTINPFASHGDRQWGIGRWEKMISYLTAYNKDVRVIIVTHESDHDRSGRWDLVHSTRMHSYDVRSIASVMANSHLTICPDSALLHVGQALDLRMLSLFGQTDYRARTCYSPRTSVICPGRELANFPMWYVACASRTTSWNMIDPEQTAMHALKILTDTYGNDPIPAPDALQFLNTGNPSTPEQLVISKPSGSVIQTEDI